MINIIDKSKCCGCASCVQRCPKQCISLVADDEGFFYPLIDAAKCVFPTPDSPIIISPLTFALVMFLFT